MLSSAVVAAPFSDDPIPVSIRKSLRNFTPLTLEQARTSKYDRPVRVYADGVFDLFHYGHAKQFRQIKSAFPQVYLIVGVCCDADVQLYKGETVMDEDERAACVMHCRYVDEVIRKAPFYATLDFVDSIKADLVAHDAIPYYGPDTEDCYKIFKDTDRFLETQRTPIVSTTELLSRVLKKDNAFRRRNEIRNDSKILFEAKTRCVDIIKSSG